MKNGIHPEYVEATVTCSCGETFQTRSTKPLIRVEICSKCHPFYTGKQKLVDSGGRVQRFQKRYGVDAIKAPARAKKAETEETSMEETKNEETTASVMPEERAADQEDAAAPMAEDVAGEESASPQAESEAEGETPAEETAAE